MVLYSLYHVFSLSIISFSLHTFVLLTEISILIHEIGMGWWKKHLLMEMYLYVCVPVTAHQSGQENLQDEYQKAVSTFESLQLFPNWSDCFTFLVWPSATD